MAENKKTSSSTKQEFKLNSFVVYPAHGIGKIVGKENQAVADRQIEVFVIEFTKEGMTLKVPVHRAKAVGLRALYSKEQMPALFNVLKQDPHIDRSIWSRRVQTYVEKIGSGDLLIIAEVVRDLYHNVKNPDRSYSERMIFESALYRITSEVAAIEEISSEESEKKVVALLSKNRATSNDDDSLAVA